MNAVDAKRAEVQKQLHQNRLHMIKLGTAAHGGSDNGAAAAAVATPPHTPAKKSSDSAAHATELFYIGSPQTLEKSKQVAASRPTARGGTVVHPDAADVMPALPTFATKATTAEGSA